MAAAYDDVGMKADKAGECLTEAATLSSLKMQRMLQQARTT